MGRPLPLLPPALRAGTLCAIGVLCANVLPGMSTPVLLALFLSLLAFLLVLLRLSVRRAALAAIASAVCCLLLGALKGIADRETVSQFPERFLGRPVQLCGTIAGMPETAEAKVRCLFRLSSVRCDSCVYPVDALVALTVTRRSLDSIQLRYGMRIVASGRLTEPSDVRNPGEMSPRTYYRANGIRYLGLARMREAVIIDSGGGSWLMRQVVVPVRSYVDHVIGASVGGKEGAFLGGLLLGDRTGMPLETKEAFVAAGVAHVLAVSGSNVAVVAGAFLLLCQLLRLPRLVRMLAVAASVVLYMLVTGAQPSVVRASIMALVLLANSLLQVKSNPLNAVGVAALIILAIDSRQLYDIGFQLSFAAVLSIMILYPPVNALISRIGARPRLLRAVVWVLRLGAVSLVATIGTLPLTAASFGAVSVISIVANLVVVPLTELSVLLGLIGVGSALIHPWLATVYGEVNRLLLHWTLVFVEYVGRLPFASVDASRFTAVDALPFYAAVAFVFYFWKHARGQGIVLLLATASVAVCCSRTVLSARESGIMRVTFIDVGQGDAILAELPGGQTLLVDAGPASGDFDAGARIVAPYLRRCGIAKVDLLVISHSHQDHVGGLPYILKHFAIGRIMRGGQKYTVPPDMSVAVEQLVAPDTLLSDERGVRLYAFPSSFTPHDTLVPGGTNSSLVLKLQYGEVSFLLAGDAETEEEEGLINAFGDFLQATLLKAGHHGSSTSSSEAFLTAVSPSLCVISVGVQNRFGHPSPEVVERLSDMGIEVVRTDMEGAIIYETDGRALSRLQWR